MLDIARDVTAKVLGFAIMAGSNAVPLARSSRAKRSCAQSAAAARRAESSVCEAGVPAG